MPTSESPSKISLTFRVPGARLKIAELLANEIGMTLSEIHRDAWLRGIGLIAREYIEEKRGFLGIRLDQSQVAKAEADEDSLKGRSSIQQIIAQSIAVIPLNDFLDRAGLALEDFSSVMNGNRPTEEQQIGLAAACGWDVDDFRIMVEQQHGTLEESETAEKNGESLEPNGT